MRCVLGWVAACGLLMCGCETKTVQNPGGGTTTDAVDEVVVVTGDTADAAAGDAVSDSAAPATDGAAASTEAAPATGEPPAATGTEPAATEPTASEPAAALTSVALAEGAAALSPENTKIQFTGTHSGDKPDPRVGGFAKFTGEAKVDPATKTLQSVSVEIETASLFTTIPDPALNEKLTTHLQSPDFFEVREYPTAKFESTEITFADSGEATIKGNLTLHGATKEISFPATVHVTDEGLTLQSDFHFNRSEFGMTFGAGQVEDQVALSVAIGEKTPTP